MNRTQSAKLVGSEVLCLALLGCGSPLIPQPAHEEVLCRAPLGHRTARRVFRWKFDALRSAIRQTLCDHGPLASGELRQQVEHSFSPEMIESLGEVHDLLFTVLLELETGGEVTRIPSDDESEVGAAYDWSASTDKLFLKK